MYFKTFTDFLHMGGYASYVWSAYGIVFIFLAINFFIPVFAKRKFLQRSLLKKIMMVDYAEDPVSSTGQAPNPPYIRLL